MSPSRDPIEPARGRRPRAAGLLTGFLGLMAVVAQAGEPPADDPGRTALAVTLERRELPPVEAMQSWFLLRGEPLEVLAVEKGPADVVVLRDPGVQPELELLARHFAARAGATQGRRRASRAGGRAVHVPAPGDERWDLLLRQPDEESFVAAAREVFRGRRGVPADRQLAAVFDALRRTCRLGDGVRLRFLSPQAAPVSKTDEPMNVFNLSPTFPAERRGFLTFVEAVPALSFVTRFADAAWLVGRELHDGGRRRALLMLIEAGSWDESFHRADVVRPTLERLQVPVHVWSFGPGLMSGQWDARLLSETSDVLYAEISTQVFDSACAELKDELEKQRIVWLKGRHPTAVITLSAAAEGVRLAGAAPPGGDAE